MKKNILCTLLALILLNSNYLFATDRVVQLSGPGGTYGSISAAITAAVDGDNIVVNNRTDGLPWIENLTINKSLTFVSAVDNVQWWMEGTISITMAESRAITIVGLKNTLSTGHITKTGTTPTNRTAVNILYSDINGNVTMGSGINFYIGSSKARNISFTFGKVIGNDLVSVTFNTDAIVSEETALIIGNRVGYWAAATGTPFYMVSTSQYLYASNNFCYGQSYGAGAIIALKSGVGNNRVINSVFSNASSGYTNFAVNHTSGLLSLENNVFCGSNASNSYGINIGSSSASLTTCTYNMYYNYIGNFPLSSSLNNFSSTVAYFTNTGTDGSIISGTAHINAGNPSNDYLDLDLSRNDVGVFGGSYSMANFWPLMNNTESSRVNYMTTPRVVNQGGTVNVQAIGFDK